MGSHMVLMQTHEVVRDEEKSENMNDSMDPSMSIAFKQL